MLNVVGNSQTKKKGSVAKSLWCFDQGLVIVPGSPATGSEGTIYPLIVADSASICSDITFYNADGILTKGTRDCKASELKLCKEDGESDCVASEIFRAVDTSSLKQKVLVNEVVAGM